MKPGPRSSAPTAVAVAAIGAGAGAVSDATAGSPQACCAGPEAYTVSLWLLCFCVLRSSLQLISYPHAAMLGLALARIILIQNDEVEFSRAVHTNGELQLDIPSATGASDKRHATGEMLL